jgi:hypothetical protein
LLYALNIINKDLLLKPYFYPFDPLVVLPAAIHIIYNFLSRIQFFLLVIICAAIIKEASRLEALAKPLPAISYAVP